MPISNENDPGKMKDSIRNRLPQRVEDRPGPEPYMTAPPVYQTAAPEPGPYRRYQFLPAFWTIASILSLAINLVLIILLLLAWQMLGRMGSVRGVQSTAMNQATNVLGGLYENFVKMDQANIRTTIHVEKDIPVNFQLNVSGPTKVTLSQPVRINGATVSVHTGGLTITNADASIVLPAGVVLPINIESLVVPVDKKVPAVIDVPVDIPLSQTELHQPFVGLREVVEPYYCLVQKFNGIQACPPPTTPTDDTLIDPALRNPAPAQTVVP
jgi:hypothetical protein